MQPHAVVPPRRDDGARVQGAARQAQQGAYYNYALGGLDMLNGAYHLLDLVPKGRDEDELSSTMEWLRHHDRYEGEVVRVPGFPAKFAK